MQVRTSTASNNSVTIVSVGSARTLVYIPIGPVTEVILTIKEALYSSSMSFIYTSIRVSVKTFMPKACSYIIYPGSILTREGYLVKVMPIFLKAESFSVTCSGIALNLSL